MSEQDASLPAGDMSRFLQAIELVEFARQWIERNDALALQAVRRRDQLDAVLRDYQSRRRWLVQYATSVRDDAGMTVPADSEDCFLNNLIEGLIAEALG